MGTILFDRGIPLSRCYEELNLLEPGTVASVHAEYLQDGAEIIETNTFGANAFRLAGCGLELRVREINLAGVQIARQCVAQSPHQACVAGAIGPLAVSYDLLGRKEREERRAAYSGQIHALAEGGAGVGVDLLILETMTSIAEASEALLGAQEAAPELCVLVMMTVDRNGNCLDGTSAEAAAAQLTRMGAHAVGCNCSDGPETVLKAIERMRKATELPLAAMPNAGLPRKLHGRLSYPISPDAMASFVPRFVDAGASLIGGCCGTTPGHTRAMRASLHALADERHNSIHADQKAPPSS